MFKMTNLVKNEKHGKASISQWFIRLKLISIIKRELEPLAIRKRNKLVVTPLELKVVFNLDVVK